MTHVPNRPLRSSRFALPLAVVAASLLGCNPLPEGPSLINPPTDTCDLTLARPEDCPQIKGRFAYGQCTVSMASACQATPGEVRVTFLGDREICQATVKGTVTCRTGKPVPACDDK